MNNESQAPFSHSLPPFSLPIGAEVITDETGRKFELKDHIGVFHKAIEDEICNQMIADFELNFSYQKTFNRPSVSSKPGLLIDDDAIDYNQADGGVTHFVFNDGMPAIYFSKQFWPCWEEYKKKFGGLSNLDDAYLNAVKVQRTSPGQGYHVWHCEQGGRDSAHKLAFYILYLNDVEEGGETEFLYQHQRIKPEKGKLVIAPACFTHMHRGNQPLSCDKYIATGWMEF